MPRPASKVTVGRGAKKATLVVAPLPPKPFPNDTMRQPDAKELCPLCCEGLDKTDKDFYPCPCGYQVCLFCYEKVKEQCNSLCPGCRREYGEPVDAPIVKQGADERAAEAARLSASGAQRAAVNGGHHPSGAHAAVAAKLVAAQQQRRGQDGGPVGHGVKREHDAALPTGATWAAAGGPASMSRHASSDIERSAIIPQTVDNSAWPSLSDSATPMRLARQELSYQSMESASSGHHRSTSVSSGSADGVPSPCSSSQDLSMDQGHPPGTGAASHSSRLMDVFGARHGSGGGGTAAGGPMSSKDASAHLVAMLRHHGKEPAEAAGSGMKSLAAAGKAPPGFGPTSHTQHIPAQREQCCSCPSNQDPSVSGPPLGRYQPIQPPTQQQQQYGSGGLYSMWSGLPGLELCIGQYDWQCPPVMQLGGGGLRMMDPCMGMPMPVTAAKTPPPGFGGPSPGLRGCQLSGSLVQQGYGGQLAGFARPPPPGMAAYRAQPL